MINLEQIKAYFRGAIADSSIFPADSTEWANKVFDPEGKAIWVKESYLNVDEGFSDSVNGDSIQGILSYSINVPIGTYDQEVGGKAVALGSLFPTATTVNTTDYKISIDSTSRSFQGVISAGSKWYTIVIDVAFKGYE